MAVINSRQRYVYLTHLGNETAPVCFQSMFTLRCNTREEPLRNTGIDMSIPKCKSEFRKKCFDYAGVKVWNDLPVEVRNSSSFIAFKRNVKHNILSGRSV